MDGVETSPGRMASVKAGTRKPLAGFRIQDAVRGIAAYADCVILRPGEERNMQSPTGFDGGVFRRISAHLAERTDVASALDAVAGEIGAAIPFTHADLCLGERPGWLVSFEVGIRTSWSRQRTRADASPIRDLLEGRCTHMLTDDAMVDPRYTFPGAASSPIFRHALRSRVNVPMKIMGGTFGTLNLSHSRPALYTEATVARAQEIADALAPYMHAIHTAEMAGRAERSDLGRQERLRRGALELTQVLERDRQRIGMDLHDQPLADLTRLVRDVAGPQPPPLPRIAARLAETIEDLRRIIDMAVPTHLDLFGFAHAVGIHLERAVEGQPVAVELRDATAGAADRLEPTTRTALFRIAQEAINNAARHAQAGRITVEIAGEEDRLTVIIRDDGRGFPAAPDRQSGLAHMRTRAQLIGAQLDIASQNGTAIHVSLEGCGA